MRAPARSTLCGAVPSSVPPGLSVPARDRGPLWVLLGGLAAAIAFVLVGLVIAGGGEGRTARAAGPAPPIAVRPAVPATAATPAPAVRSAPAAQPQRRSLDERRFARNDRRHVRAAWVAAFYPLYERTARAYGVNWLLLASVHKQETGFSTHPTTYRGLNFARCCAGPMQFNVTNGPVTTWDRYRHSHRAAQRPPSYNHQTDRHPSPYDDFDALMAAAALLRDSGAGAALDATAWRAAYDYYGHDLTGIDYASTVVARAIGWGRGGFCINCEVDAGLVSAVDGAWGAPVRQAVVAADEAARRERERERRARAERRAGKDGG